jgi:Ca-activated chloride channel family protein
MGRVRPKEVKLREEVTRRFVWLFLTVLCFAAPARPQAPARTQQTPIRTQQVPAKPDDTIIRVNVRLVRMLVTAKDAAGQLIGSLNKGDFAVYDNGVKQEIAVFDRETEQPLSVAMLVDTSASTGIELRYELDSVSRFLKVLLDEGNPDDTVALYSFNEDVRLLTSYTRRFARVDRMLKLLKSEGGTSVYDALFLASRELEYRNGRHVMVLVTDGGDTTSIKDFHQALEAAQLADAILYPVLVVPITNDAGRNVGGENALTTLAAGTGGHVFTPNLGAQLDRAFDDILRELRTQYLIAFYPKDVPPTKERFHTLKVTVQSTSANRGLRVTTRSGYYGESNESRSGLGH